MENTEKMKPIENIVEYFDKLNNESNYLTLYCNYYIDDDTALDEWKRGEQISYSKYTTLKIPSDISLDNSEILKKYLNPIWEKDVFFLFVLFNPALQKNVEILKYIKKTITSFKTYIGKIIVFPTNTYSLAKEERTLIYEKLCSEVDAVIDTSEITYENSGLLAIIAENICHSVDTWGLIPLDMSDLQEFISNAGLLYYGYAESYANADKNFDSLKQAVSLAISRLKRKIDLKEVNRMQICIHFNKIEVDMMSVNEVFAQIIEETNGEVYVIITAIPYSGCFTSSVLILCGKKPY